MRENLEKKIGGDIAQSLDDFGFKFAREWGVNTLSNKKLRLDFFIHYPTRAFIEIKISTLENWDELRCQRWLDYMQSIFFDFNKQIVPIFVAPTEVIQAMKAMPSELPIFWVDYDTDDPTAGNKVATKIRNQYVHQQSPFDKVAVRRTDFDFRVEREDVSETKSKVGELYDVLLSFKPLLAKHHFKTLEDEIAQFHAEFNAAHYTTAALRIGRTLEFIFYVLSIDWGVQINKLSIRKIRDLRSLFDTVEERLIDYLNADQKEKPKFKKILQKQNTEVLVGINNLIFEIDEHEVEDTETPINLNSLVRDIKYHFRQQQIIREEFDQIIQKKLVQRLTARRNEAAHADTSGERREFMKNDLDDMIDDLKTILFHLCNIASNARNIRNEDTN